MKHRVYKIHTFLMKQYFAETLPVISFKNDVPSCTDEVREKVPSFKEVTLFFYDINHNTEPLSIYVDVTGCRDIRRINLKSFVSIGLVVRPPRGGGGWGLSLDP